jgi:hypothetical protein
MKTKQSKTAKIVAELKRLARKNGGLLKPETVVEAARPETSPLHSRFEWDDSVAGEKYRIWQARQLIRVTVEVCERTNEPMEVFVSLTTDRRPEDTEAGDEVASGYRVMTEVLTDAELREQMLADALAELKWFKEKYKHLCELAEVFSAIDRVRK